MNTHKEWEQQYKLQQDDQLRQVGLVPEALTQEQRSLIFQLEEAPENYYQDGEISSDDAYYWWIEKLKRSGLNGVQISRAIKLNFN